MSDQIVMLSGPLCARKSSVAEALCAGYDRMAHIDVDALRHFVRAGYVHPRDESPEWQR